MDETGVIIEGFYFSDEKEIEQARREAEGVAYIRVNTDMENAEAVLRLYHKLMEEELFETPVGISFLKELWDYLAMIPSMDLRQLEPIRIRELMGTEWEKDGGVSRGKPAEEKKGRREIPVEERKLRAEQRLKETRKKLGVSMLLNLFLVLLAVGMVIISLNSSNPNILNYENRIIDKYAGWQQELEQREQTLKEKEAELVIKP